MMIIFTLLLLLIYMYYILLSVGKNIHLWHDLRTAIRNTRHFRKEVTCVIPVQKRTKFAQCNSLSRGIKEVA